MVFIDHTHLLGLLVIVLVAADVVRAAVSDPVGGGGGRGGGVDPVGPAGLSSRGVPVGGGGGRVGRGVGAVAGAEQLVRLGLQLLGMRRLLTHEGSLKRDRAENKWKAIIIRVNHRRTDGRQPSFEEAGF